MAAARGLLAFAVLLSSCIALAVAQSAPVPLASLPGCGSANAPLAAPLASGLDNCVISGLVGANGTVGWGFTIAEDVDYSLLMTLRVVGGQAQL